MSLRLQLLSALLAGCLSVALFCGCGGGASGVGAVSARSDGKIAISAQSVKLTDEMGRDTGRTLAVPAAVLSPGDECGLDVTLSDSAGVAGCALSIAFPRDVFACASAAVGDAVSSADEAASYVASGGGSAAVAVASTTAAPAGSRVLASFRLRARSDAIPRSIALKLAATLVDGKGKTIGRAGAVSPAAVRPQGSALIGDLMGTGKAEVGSAVRILRVVVGVDARPSSAKLWQWDCNSSKSVDVGDAIRVLRCVVGLAAWPIVAKSPDLDPILIGKWKPIIGTRDGAIAPLSSILGWPTGETDVTDEYLADGTYRESTVFGDATGATVTDTWTAASGTLTTGAVPYPIGYSVSGNVLTLAFATGGHNCVVKYAKLVTLTGHDPGLVGNWQATSARLDGVTAPIHTAADLLGTSDWMIMSFDATMGQVTVTQMKPEGDGVYSKTGPWATGGGLIDMFNWDLSNFDSQMTMYSGSLVTTNYAFAGGKPHTIEITWTRQ